MVECLSPILLSISFQARYLLFECEVLGEIAAQELSFGIELGDPEESFS